MTNQREIAELGLATVLRESAGLELNQMDRSANFLELGFDSLFLIQMSQRLKRKLGVKVGFRQLIEEISTADLLVDYLANSKDLVGSSLPKSNSVAATYSPPAPTTPIATPAPTSTVPAVTVRVETTTAANTPDIVPTAIFSETTRSIPSASSVGLNSSVQNLNVQPSAPLPYQLPTGQSTTTNSIGVPQSSGTALEQIIMQQNAMMLRHLELMYGPSAVTSSVSQSLQPVQMPAEPSEPAIVCNESCDEEIELHLGSADSSIAGLTSNQVSVALGSEKTFERFGPYKPVRKGLNNGLTEHQASYLQQFMERYIRRTSHSQHHAQTYRAHFTDPREVASYRRIWKSMAYQVVVDHSKGSKLWDIDGNEYIDIAMGFGLNLFGQSPSFITEALHRQLDRGVEVGPQTPLAGEAAALLCQFARKDRATFCNTGSEAVMAALRLARLVTGKTKTVYFNKDYHGNFDQVLLRTGMAEGQPGSSPAAPGVPDWYSKNTIVLPYCSPESLKIIEQFSDDIAAVLVEPCQSADPFIQPREFLQELRRITRERKIALIMDEVITGFRAAPGGAQEWYDVWGDMATYGKILGGGMPIGALAGRAEYMDGLDGGFWNFHDDSEPDADMTFFAGTFVRHPLAIAAAYEVLKKIKEEGPQLQQQLTQKTEFLTSNLNQFFEREQFPIRVAQFSSLFRFMFPPDLEFADMLYFHLLEKGIFTRGWGDNCFLSTAHSDDDIQRIIKSVKEGCLEIRVGGFFPDKVESARRSDFVSQRDAETLHFASPAGSVSVNAEMTDAGLFKKKDDHLTGRLPTDGHTSGSANQVGHQNGIVQQDFTSSTIPFHAVTVSQSPTSIELSKNHLIIADARDAGYDQDRMSTINPIQEKGDLPPLFCMPAADGLTLLYHELSQQLGDDQPVYGLDSPAIYREAIPDTLEELATRFISDMQEIQPSGPYLIVGYCSGGTTALEVARQLIEGGEEVAMLALLETYNWWDAPSTNPTWWTQTYYQYERIKFHFYNFLKLGLFDKVTFFGSKLTALVNRLGVWKGKLTKLSSKNKINTLGMVNKAEIWKKHDEIAEAYFPTHYPGRIINFRPKRDYRCHLGSELEADEVVLHRLNCYPAGMMSQPFVKTLAKELNFFIQQSLDETELKDQGSAISDGSSEIRAIVN